MVTPSFAGTDMARSHYQQALAVAVLIETGEIDCLTM